ncbi:MAG: right-handed parallel beta-helix repeat-containing protein [Verrucomicrobia bacterium]|nr:right-handed parallel beta-helix repeat-containing protein [Verrucomicrobiota bacterium]
MKSRDLPQGFGSQKMAWTLFLGLFVLMTRIAAGTIYYLNDTGIVGDVYCSVGGNDSNSGLSNNAPKLTLTNLLATYTLAAGDIVYIDTGVYSNYTTTITTSGAAGNPIIFQGSTNAAVGGSVFQRNAAQTVFYLLNVNYIHLRDLVLRDGSSGIYFWGAQNCEAFRVTARKNTTQGFFLGYSSVRMIRCLVVESPTGVESSASLGAWDQGVLWSNTLAFNLTTSNSVSVSNSVIVGGTAYNHLPAAADYNVYWNTVLGGSPGGQGAQTVEDLHWWKNNSFWSMHANPSFANPTNLDFHPMSITGRYNVATGLFVTDAVHSVLIDFGDPARTYGQELSPNGARMNAGLYGDTAEASKSRTNTWLLTVSFNGGGTLYQTGRLTWAFGNIATTETVKVEYSPDNKASWYPVATNLPITNLFYLWNASSITSTPTAYWRVTRETVPAVSKTSDTNFAIRGLGLVPYYVNDASTDGDVYTSNPGAPGNNGTTPATPKDSIQSLMDAYTLNGDHVIYVDTGVYTQQTTTVAAKHFGISGRLVTLQGSTNTAAGGAVLDRQNAGADVLVLSGTRFIAVRDLILRGGRYGLWASGTSDGEYENILSRNNVIGFLGSGTANNHTFRRCASAFNTIGAQGFSSGIQWNYGVAHSNATAFLMSTPAQWAVSNSVIVGGKAFWGTTLPGAGDYNLFWDTMINSNYANLSALQKGVNGWWNCAYANPHFVDPYTNANFHLRSVTGTWSNGFWAPYTNHSPAIDFGDPSAPYGNETGPNGSNVNAGIYGNTPQASWSRTNTWLLAMSYNDGGTLNAPLADRVYWRSGNLPPGATVRIDLSLDGGATWEIAATNISALVGYYAWANTNFTSSRLARWRVVYESNTNVMGATTYTNFTFQNGPYKYYLNDNSTTGDIYCATVGSDANTGTSAGNPKYSLKSLVDDHEIQASDIIYMDTGRYQMTADQLISALDTGASNLPVTVLGSTNIVAGGTVIDRRFGAVGLHLNGASYYDIRDITVSNAATGVRLQSLAGTTLTRVTAQGNSTAGMDVQNSTNVVLDQCATVDNRGDGLTVSGAGTQVLFRRGIHWRNRSAGVRSTGGQIAISNSVVVASGVSAYGYHAAATNNIVGNYNVLYVESNAVAGFVTALGKNLDTLGTWVAETGQDRHSLETDPLFANPAGPDFHLKTDQRDSRWITGAGWNPGFDATSSPLIDAGDPTALYTNELPYNGGRINIGRYGHTAEASKRSVSNWIHAASLRQGGWVKGTSTLHWVVGGAATGHLVQIEFSPDGGATWSTLTNNVPAAAELFTWNTWTVTNTPAGLWRISSQTEPALADATTNFFAVRNAPLTFFINDIATNEDVYTSAPGAATNWQATSARPLDSLARALAVYNLEPGDTVYVDTGSYTNTADILVERRHSGLNAQPVLIVGSTNWAAGGTVQVRSGAAATDNGMRMEYVQGIIVSNINFRGGRTGVRISNSGQVQLSRVSVTATSNGVDILSSTNILLLRIASYGNTGSGLNSILGSGVQAIQSVLWSNTAGALRAAGGTVLVTNSVLEASGVGTYVYTLLSNAVVRADYNDLLARNGAYVSLETFYISKAMSTWKLRTTNDLRSLSHEPLFYDPAAGDFHPRSSAGRYDPFTGAFAGDTTNSPLIDTGHPSWPFAEESGTNGARINIGLYGNDAQASRSRTNAWLLALSLNDGGTVRGTSTVYFVAGGVATGHQVTIDFSWDGGTSWTNVGTNVAASAGLYEWDTTKVRATSQGILRYRSQAETSAVAQTESLFAVNNDPLTFYINDSSTNGDVYALAAGQSYYDGLTADYPADSISTILKRYDPQAGDRIYVDTGSYAMSNVVTIGSATLGTLTNLVIIQGSTNIFAGGSVLDFQGQNIGFLLQSTEGVNLRNLRIRNAKVGVKVYASTDCLLDFVWVQGANYGFEVEASRGVGLSRCAAVGSVTTGVYNARSSNTVWRNGVLWSNRVGILLTMQSLVSGAPENLVVVSNSVIAVFGTNAMAYTIWGGTLYANYNALYLADGARMADRSDAPYYLVYDTVARWSAATTQDVNSLTGHPELNNPAAEDFHPKSPAGRFNPLTGVFVTTDTVTSLLIDSAPKTVLVTNETPFNGLRANIGMYGNTDEASRTPTNTSLRVVSFNDGGMTAGTNVSLRWVARGNATGHLVRLDFSWDSGTNWAAIATNRPARDEEYLWDSTAFTSTLFGVWKITSEQEGTVSAQNATPFALRNTNFLFYVNDTNTTGDLYTTAAGADLYSGLGPAAPKPSMQSILDAYDLEGGDVIYVDTGVYTGSQAQALINQFDSGRRGDSLKLSIIGSTNYGVGGTVLDVRSGVFALQVREATGVDFRDFSVMNVATSGVWITQSENCYVEGVSTRGGGVGFHVEGSIGNEFRHCAAVETDIGLRNLSGSNTVWQHGVLWSNRVGVSLGVVPGSPLANKLDFSNSVVGLFGTSRFAFDGDPSGLRSDYNNLYLQRGAYVGNRPATPFSENIPTLARWIEVTGQDQHSLSHHPGFSQEGVDFHLVSRQGRFSWAVTNFVFTDTTNSILLDAGGPDDDYNNEPDPNGARLNIGLYGNTWQASMTPTNARLTAVSLNAGGVARGTNYVLYWVATGDATGHTVRIVYSGDGGITWTNLATNLAAQTAQLAWDTTQQASTLLGVWEVRSETDTNVFDRSSVFFAIRNTPMLFYVNDANAAGDVYTTALGQSTNNGLFAHTPKTSLQDVLDTWDVEPGDIIYVDTGSYTSSTGYTVGQLDGGNYSNQIRVVIQGSTNEAAGGTVFVIGSTATGITLNQAEAMELRHLTIRGAQVGVSLSQSRRCLLEWLRIEDGITGVQVASRDTVMRHCLIRGMTTAGFINTELNTVWQGGVLWSNQYGVYLASGNATVKDSVIAAFGSDAAAYHVQGGAVLAADYNNLYLGEGALAAYRPLDPYPDVYHSLSRWVWATGQDGHSFSHDPLFADSGAGDFRLMSQAGRWSPSITNWIEDAVTSPLLDAATPTSAWTNEPSPNGARRNIGIYGDSVQASKTPTNAVLTVVSLNDGGRAEGVIPLYWVPRGNATGHTIRLQYSADAGSSWQSIVTNVPAAAGVYYWSSLSFTSSIRGVWQVQSEQDGSVQDTNNVLFALRNQRLNFYVNDSSTNGNVYSTAPGEANNSGATPEGPMDDVQRLVDRWDLEPGDTIYVDTGEYLLAAPIVMDRFDAWESTNMVMLAQGLATNRMVIQGSTNEAAGGTVFLRFGTGYLIHLDTAPGVGLRHLTLRGGTSVLRADSSSYGLAEWVRCENGHIGFDIASSAGFEMRRCVTRDHLDKGLAVYASPATTWRNGVIWSNKIGAWQYRGTGLGGGSLTVEHSVLAAFGEDRFAFQHVAGAWTSDYNNVYLVDGAMAGGLSIGQLTTGRTNRLESVFFWSRAMTNDFHTLSEDPKFADAAAGDFHLHTTRPGGRYDPILGVWTNDADFSRLIDAGNPASACSDELAPNGNRINIGLYGNTWQASKTPTNAWVTLITLHDGGSLQGLQPLYWVAGGAATGHQVYLDFAHVSGIDNWTNVATNVAAALGTYPWNSAGYGRAAAGELRITSASDSSINATSRVPIVLRDESGSIWYFVNNSTTNNDVYTTAIGKSSNPGTTPYWPKASIQDVLYTYKLEPVDVIWVDTGEYLMTSDIVITDLDSGSGTNRITLQGSTNWAAGGTVLNRQVTGVGTAVIRLEQASGLNVRDFTLRGAHTGMKLNFSADCRLENVRALENGVDGFRLEESTGIEFVRCVSWKNGSTNGVGLVSDKSSLSWSNGLIWANATAVNFVQAGPHWFRNSILQAVGLGKRIFDLDLMTGINALDSDYNNLLVVGGATIAEKDVTIGGNDLYGSLVDWQTLGGKDQHSLSHAPLFADEVSGDFRLMSQAGRFRLDGTITNDAVTSPLIDTGNPSSTWTNELDPNGSRINIGPDGNSPGASLSPTNPWLLAVSINAGGIFRGTNTLLWASGNLSTAALLRLEYTRNGGIEWFVIASNVLNVSTGHPWDASAQSPTVQAKWRVIYQGDTNVWDETDSMFAIKNQALTIYINDSSLAGDVYCSAPGHPSNSGLTNSAPLSDPSMAMAQYPIGAGDVIYIDTGTYNLNTNMYLGELNRGTEEAPIRVLGSTNIWAGGSLVNRGDNFRPAFLIQNTRYIEVRDLRFTGAGTGLEIINLSYADFSGIHSYKNRDGITVNTLQGGTFDRCAVWSNRAWGVSMSGSGQATWERGVFWGNRAGALQLSSYALTLSDSIIQGKGTSILYQVQNIIPVADYNILWKEESAVLARNAQYSFDYLNLQSWQRNTGADTHGALLDPRMNNPGSGDFTLRSTTGRYSFVVSNFVVDAENSWAIDAGNPAGAYGLEPTPNGGRRNAGLYGHTPWASKSPTDTAVRALLAVSMNDGGLVQGTKEMYWLSRALTAADLVRIEFSANNGVDWSVIASNLPATPAGYAWDTTVLPSTPLGRWRVILQSDTNIADVVDQSFILRNGPITFYVNDVNLSGDVYTTAPGSPANDGLSSNTPKDSLQGILAYDLEGGDTILVDTGVYVLSNEVYFTALHSGAATARVHVVGSTNLMAGGTVISGTTNINAILLRGASFIEFSDLTIHDVLAGVVLDLFSNDNVFRRIVFRDGTLGVSANQSAGNRFEQVLITRQNGPGLTASSAYGTALEGCVIWENDGSAVEINSTSILLSNSILRASGSTNFCFNIGTNSSVLEDCNILFTTNGANVAFYNGVVYEKLLRWTEVSGQGVHSLSEDPLFANPTALDFHLQSVAGRYLPGVGWTNDPVHSPAIDTGALQAPVGSEPSPNGGRRNIGLYGGTVEASKSVTNDWLKALSGHTGGRIGGLFYLAWAGWSSVPTNTVRLDYSFDNGSSWTTIVQQVLLTNFAHLWNSATWPISPISRWRVVLEANTNVWDANDVYFGLNGPFSFYVNDTNVIGDVYTTAPGTDTNFGLYPFMPKATINSVLEAYDLEGGDSIWIDSGTYFITTNNPILLTAGDVGMPGLPVTIRGNTNLPLTVFEGNWVGSPQTLLAIQGGYLGLSHLGFRLGQVSASGDQMSWNNLVLSNASLNLSGNAQTVDVVNAHAASVAASGRGVGLRYLTLQNGKVSLSGTNTTLLHSLVTGGSNPAVNVVGDQIVVRNNTLVGAGTRVRKGGPGNAVIENNILAASGADRFCILWEDGTIESDYNLFYARSNAWVGNRNGFWERLLYWQRESGMDLHSLAGDPLFADEAGGDYHLKSVAGRWTAAGWTNDPVHSPAIDAGNPDTEVNEPLPSGYRVNIGAYGNTDQASLSQDGAWLQALTANDGGVLKGTNIIRWTSALLGPEDDVCIEYTTNNWTTWFVVACGIPATEHQYAWDTTLVPSSLQAGWRVVLETNTAVEGRTEQPFAVRNTALLFYVNNASTQNNVYTTQPGNDANDGLSPSTPKATLQGLLDTYDTEGGDVIYVDTGIYTNTSDIRVIWSRGGQAGYGNLVIQGSTNYTSGGSIITRNTLGGVGVDVKASRIAVRDLAIHRHNFGLRFDTNELATAERLRVVSNNYGIVIRESRQTTNRNIRFWNNYLGGIDIVGARTTLVEHCTFVGNSNSSYSIAGTVADTVQNNIFVITTPSTVPLAGSSNLIKAAFIDYNIYYFPEGGTIFGAYTNLQKWQLDEAHDFRSAITNPLLANVGGGDFHLQSTTGRWVDGAGWTTDAENSWAIDKAKPTSPYDREPSPHGYRANIGAYGNTEYASLGDDSALVNVRTFNQTVYIGGDTGKFPLVWYVRHLPTNETVKVQYSGDGGATWYDLASGINAYQEYIIWNTSPYYNTYNGYWRVVGESNTNYWDVNDEFFQIFYGDFIISNNYRNVSFNRIVWRGAWGSEYTIEVATNSIVTTNILTSVYTNDLLQVRTNSWREVVIPWTNAPSGVGQYRTNPFIATQGGNLTFEDIGSSNSRYRLYRVIQQ